MTHIFYIITVLMAILELMKMLRCRTLFYEYRKIGRMNKRDRNLYLQYNADYAMLVIADIAEIVFCFIGLLSSQWFAFAFILLLTYSKFKHLGIWALAIDNMLSICAFLFAAINKYHHLILQP